MLPEKQLQAWRVYYRTARKNDQFDERTSLLLHLASAMSVGCVP